MTDPSTEARLRALQRSGRASSGPTTPPKPAPPPESALTRAQSTVPAERTRAGSSGAKWTLAGGAIGATFAMMGAMSAAGRHETTPVPVASTSPPQQIVIVIPQPSTPPTETAPGLPDDIAVVANTPVVSETIPELPRPVAEQAPVQAKSNSESGGS